MATSQVVIFNIDNESFGVNISQVIEIIKPQEMVKVPNTPEFIEGIINLRGKVHAIFSLRKKFKLAVKAYDENTKIVIVNANSMNIGFIVDEVREIVKIEDEDIEEAPGVITDINHKYISGVAKMASKMIILLDLNLVLSTVEQDVAAEVIAKEI